MSFFITSPILAEPPLGARPNFKQHLIDENETVGSVLDFEQDRYGFIWVAGKGGLARFDGYRFHFYEKDPQDPHSLPESLIHHVFEDRHGELWFTTEGGGVLRLNRALDNFHIYQPQEGDPTSISNLRVRTPYEDWNGDLWFTANGGGLNRYIREADHFERHLADTQVGHLTILDMLQLSEHRYLLASDGGGLFIWTLRAKIFSNFSPAMQATLCLQPGRTLHRDTHGQIWVGSEVGLSRFDPNTQSFHTVELPSIYATGYTAVWRITEDERGLLWLASDGSGMIYFDPLTLATGQYKFNAAHKLGLSCSVVRHVFIDQIGDFWVGCFPGGINHFDTTNRLFESHLDFVVNQENRSSVWAFSEDKDGLIWLGMGHNGLYVYDRHTDIIGNTYRGLDLSQTKIPNAVLSLFEDSQGMLWIGSWGRRAIPI